MKTWIKRKTLTVAALLSLGILTPIANAEPVNPKHLANDARWYAHFDAQAAKKSEIYKEVLALVGQQFPVEELAAQVKQAIGVDPFKDIKGITVYSNTFEEDVAAILIYAKVDKTLLTQAVANNPEHKEVMFGQHMLHSWLDNNDGKTKVGCFWGDGLVLMADKMDTLKAAVDVLDGKSKNQPEIIKPIADGVFLNAAAALAKSPDKNVASLLSDVEPTVMSIGESEGKIVFIANTTAKTADQATQISNILTGLRAFADMATKDTPVTNGLLKQVKLTTDGAKLIATFSHQSKSLIETIKAVEKEQSAKAAKNAQGK